MGQELGWNRQAGVPPASQFRGEFTRNNSGQDGMNAATHTPEMLARARKKANKAGTEWHRRSTAVSRLSIRRGAVHGHAHHLGRPARQQCAQEVRRVLKPGGRVLAVDFAEPTEGSRGLLDHFHHHGYLNFQDLAALFTQAGLNIAQSGVVGIGNLQFVLASVPCGA